MSWSNDKKLSSGADVIGWNFQKKIIMEVSLIDLFYPILKKKKKKGICFSPFLRIFQIGVLLMMNFTIASQTGKLPPYYQHWHLMTWKGFAQSESIFRILLKPIEFLKCSINSFKNKLVKFYHIINKLIIK